MTAEDCKSVESSAPSTARSEAGHPGLIDRFSPSADVWAPVLIPVQSHIS